MKQKQTVKESVGRRATRTFFSSVVGKFLALVITLLTFILVARLLGPSNYGIYTVAIGYGTLIGSVSIFGIAAYFDRHISFMSYKKDTKGIGRILSNGYSIIIPVSAILMGLGIALSGYIATNFLANSGVEPLTLVIISIDIFFSTVWGASYSALIGFGKGKLASIDIVVLGIVQLVFGIGLIYAGYGVTGAVAGILIGDIVGFGLTCYHVYRSATSYGEINFGIPAQEEIRDTLRFALPLATNNVMLVGVVGFGTLFLSMYATNFIIGNYGTALKGLGMMNVIYGTLAIVLIQSFSTFISQKKKREEIAISYNKTLEYSLLLNLPIVVFVGVFAQPIIFTFLGSSFAFAPLYLTLIAVGTSILIMNSFTSSFFIASGKVGELMKISLISVVAQIILLIILVPKFTAVGAIASLYTIGTSFTMFLYSRSLKKNFGIMLEYKKLLSIFVANLVLAMLLSSILYVPGNIVEIVLGLIVLLLIYPPLLVLFRGIEAHVLTELENLVLRMPIVGFLMANFGRYTQFFIKVLEKE